MLSEFYREMPKYGVGAGLLRAAYEGCLLQLILAAAIGVSLWQTLVAPNESFQQSVWVEVSAGIGFFWIALCVLPAARSDPVKVTTILGTLAIASGVTAYFASGLAQSFLLEACVGFLLLVALEIILNIWVNSLDRRIEELMQELERLEERA